MSHRWHLSFVTGLGVLYPDVLFNCRSGYAWSRATIMSTLNGLPSGALISVGCTSKVVSDLSVFASCPGGVHGGVGKAGGVVRYSPAGTVCPVPFCPKVVFTIIIQKEKGSKFVSSHPFFYLLSPLCSFPILAASLFRYDNAAPFHYTKRSAWRSLLRRRQIFPIYLTNSLLWPYAGILFHTELGFYPFWGKM